MKYITGIHALDLPYPLWTSSAYHTPIPRCAWEDITFVESNGMFFKDYGIDQGITIPYHQGSYAVANHIRAFLDLLQWSDFAKAQGIHDRIYDPYFHAEVIEKAYSMLVLNNWEAIDYFMEKEYPVRWADYKRTRSENPMKRVTDVRVERGKYEEELRRECRQEIIQAYGLEGISPE